MLTTADALRLIEMPKELIVQSPQGVKKLGRIDFPGFGNCLQLEAQSADGHEQFTFDVNRRGQFRLTKCTYQERYARTERLLRLDIEGPPHVNPDGEEIPCPHLHEYREGYDLKWARPAPSELLHSQLWEVLASFLQFCKVDPVPRIQGTIE
jgi:hypothetical protein